MGFFRIGGQCSAAVRRGQLQEERAGGHEPGLEQQGPLHQPRRGEQANQDQTHDRYSEDAYW